MNDSCTRAGQTASDRIGPSQWGRVEGEGGKGEEREPQGLTLPSVSEPEVSEAKLLDILLER